MMILKMSIGTRVGYVSLIFVILFALFISSMKLTDGYDNSNCIESEGKALLSFKHGLQDNNGMLSSWNIENIEDCCNWKGVKCSNLTNNIIELHLHGNFDQSCLFYDTCTTKYYLSGEIGPSLLELSHLNYLDLSSNAFWAIPNLIGSLVNLKYLDLSFNGFSGYVPPHLGNLSSLDTLDLRWTLLISENLEWLSRLSSLQYLDLSGLNLENARDWMQIISKLPHLETLVLAYCNLPPPIFPSYDPYINISTSLSMLDLSRNHLTSSIFPWLFHFNSSLFYLNLGYNILQGYIPNAFGNMTYLSHIYFDSNQLEGLSPNLFWNFCNLRSLSFTYNNLKGNISDFLQISPGCALNSLQYLHFDYNRLSGPVPDFSTFLNLKILDLSFNQVSGKIPMLHGQFSNLETLDFSHNQLSGSLPNFSTFQNLVFLDLSFNQFSGNFLVSHGQLSNLKNLDFSNNKFSGPLPDFSTFQNLTELDLSFNEFSGKVPVSLGQLSNLQSLDIGNNFLEGIIFESHFSKQNKLRSLDFSHNSLEFQLSSDWIPPFQLETIRLSSCKLGPKFPQWFEGQHFVWANISNTGISDTIPYWFWNISYIYSLDLSNNQIRGEIPSFSAKSVLWGVEVNLRSNEFEGQIPNFLFQSRNLDVSNNRFSGLNNLCGINTISSLYFLDASNNQFLGEVPNCWRNLSDLTLLSLANNGFMGGIPSSFSYLNSLQSLRLSNNSFSSEFPSWLKKLNGLQVLDLEGNYFTGAIPSWIGTKLPTLRRLNLRSNQFDGELPSSLCHLNHILFLDLSLNNITGVIPNCLHSLSALVMQNNNNQRYNYTSDEMTVMWKGRESVMKETLAFLRSIDLSGNHLTGKIPNEITALVNLVSLNLSRNNLTGGIPENIGQLKSLDFLDLSRNKLEGQIPSSLSQIDRLGVLDLSFNKLSGKIPDGTQLQSFDPSTYAGNLDLCGSPLPRCSGEETVPTSTNQTKVTANENEFATQGFYISLAVGFVLGFWGISGTLMVHRSCRHAYFGFMNDVNDWLYVKTAIFTYTIKKLFNS